MYNFLTHSALWSLPLVLASAVLGGCVCMGPGMCVAVAPFSCPFLRLRGERSTGLLSVPVGDLAPELKIDGKRLYY